MASLFSILAIFCLTSYSWAQGSTGCDINRYSPKFIPLEDFYEQYGPHLRNRHLIADYNPAKMKPRLEVALQWIKGYTEGIKGSDAASHYNNFYTGNPEPEVIANNLWYQSTGLLGCYFLRVISRYLYCTSEGKIGKFPGPAWIDISFNNFNHFARLQSKSYVGNTVTYTIEGKPVFLLPEMKRSENRVDYYEFPGPVPDDVVNYAKTWFYHAYIVRNSDMPLFIPVTRKQFLKQYLQDMEAFYHYMKKMYKEQTVIQPPEYFEKGLEERIDEIKRLTEQGAWGYSPESLNFRIETAKNHYKQLKEEETVKLKNLLSKTDDDYAESVRIIHEYLDTQPEFELSKPMRTLPPPLFEPEFLKQKLEEMDKHLDEPTWGNNTIACYLNPDYFKKPSPPDVPQFITIEIVNIENLHEHLNDIADNINRKYDFEALKALLK